MAVNSRDAPVSRRPWMADSDRPWAPLFSNGQHYPTTVVLIDKPGTGCPPMLHKGLPGDDGREYWF